MTASQKPFGNVPAAAKQQPENFEVHIDEQKLSNFKQLLRLSPIGKNTYENQQQDRRFGVTREWMASTKNYWETKFDWRAQEERINSFPNFKTDIKDDDGTVYSIHFAALFSENPNAVPIVFLHGWPGSFLEFLDLMDLVRKKYSPKDSPYHIIAPSLPGYAFSTAPPLDEELSVAGIARIMHKLLVSIGFESGYVAQGGDIGSFVARQLAVNYDSCKGLHLNFMIMLKPDHVPDDAMTELEAKQMARFQAFMNTGRAYAIEHATRPATIGLTLAASPIALLAWIGEKFLEWTDEDLPLDTVLADITLYWLCETYPSSIYTYRQEKGMLHAEHVDKPLGYSYFPYELLPVPKSWAETSGNLVFFKAHEGGGHFAALEKPDLLLQDVDNFVKASGIGQKLQSHI